MILMKSQAFPAPNSAFKFLPKPEAGARVSARARSTRRDMVLLSLARDAATLWNEEKRKQSEKIREERIVKAEEERVEEKEERRKGGTR